VGTELLPGSDTAAPTIIKLPGESTDFATVLSFTSTVGDGSTGILKPTGTTIANTVKYQWYRDGVAIANATKAKYTLTTADNGHGIKLRIVTSHGAVGSRTFTTDVRYTDEQDYSIEIDPGHEPYQSTNTWTLGSQGGLYGTGQFQTPDGLIMDHQIKIQWLRAGVAIAGATSDTYTIQAADYNKILSVRYIVGKVGYTPLMGVTTGQLVGKGITLGNSDGYTDASVTIEPGPGVGTLKAQINDLTPPTPTPAYTYRWYRGSTAITGATASTYKLVSADKGAQISVKVVMTRTNFVVPVTTLQSPSADYAIYADPAVPTTASGVTSVGQVLHATPPSTFYDDPGLSTVATGLTVIYTWYRSGAAISGATAADYTLTASDLGKTITVRATATKAGRLAAASPPSLASSPITIGTIDVGSLGAQTSLNLSTRKATVTFTGTAGTPSLTKTYQWYRNGVAISGATASSFVLATTDTNKSITVRVRLSRTGFTTYTYPASAGQSVGILVNGLSQAEPIYVTGGNDLTSGSVGQTLSCVAPFYYRADGSQLLAGTNPGDTQVRQWTSDGSPIVGQTGYQYTVVAGDVGHGISCTVTNGAKLHKTLIDGSANTVAIS
jgi:hypothetical protein